MVELAFESSVVTVEIVGRVPTLRLRVDGRLHDVVYAHGDDGTFTIDVDGATHRGFVYAGTTSVWIRLNGRTLAFDRSLAAAKLGPASTRLEVRTDMPGMVVAVHVAEGDAVAPGDPLITLESMKLQLTVNADRTGTIAKLFLRAGASFERDAPLLTYASPATDPEATPEALP